MDQKTKGQHTLGEWSAEELFFGQPNRMVIMSGEKQIADLGLVGSEETRANAALMAAAPELLDMVYRALPYIEEAANDPVNKPEAVRDLLKQMISAIEKAEDK